MALRQNHYHITKNEAELSQIYKTDISVHIKDSFRVYEIIREGSFYIKFTSIVIDSTYNLTKITSFEQA